MICPFQCQHRLVEHADSWFISTVLLAVTDYVGLHAFILRLTKRHEMWMMADNDLTPDFYIGAQEFMIRLKMSPAINSRQYMTWIDKDMRSHTNHPFLRLGRVFGNDDRMLHLFRRSTFTWLSFIKSRDVYAYYDENEQIGLKSYKHFRDQDEIDCGTFSLTFIGKRCRRIERDGVRWSTLEDSYFGGGPSLLNHACQRHANVYIEYDNGYVIAMKAIQPYDILRVNYEEDSEVLRITRGVICHECFQ